MKSLYVFCMYGLFVTVVINQVLPIPEPLYRAASSLLLILFLSSTLWRSRGFMLIASLLALVAGHGLLIAFDLGFAEWHAALTKAIFIPLLFVVIPLIAVPINNGGYLDSLVHFVTERRHRLWLVFLTLAVINLAMAITLNIASIIIFQRLLDPLNLPPKFLARLYMAVYGAYMVFSPYDPVINMLLLYQGVPYAAYFLPGLVMAVTVLGIGFLLVQLDRPLCRELARRLPPATGSHSVRKLAELLLHVVALILLAFLGSFLLPETPTILIVAGIIVIYSPLWITQVRALPALQAELLRYSENFEVFAKFLPFLLSLSFFGSVVSHTPIRTHLAELMASLYHLPPYWAAFSCMVLVAALSLCSIHMIIPVTTLALTVSPGSLALSHEAYICLLLASWVAGMIASPLVPFAVIASATIRTSTATFTFRWAPPMLLCWLGAAPAVIMGINALTVPG